MYEVKKIENDIIVKYKIKDKLFFTRALDEYTKYIQQVRSAKCLNYSHWGAIRAELVTWHSLQEQHLNTALCFHISFISARVPILFTTAHWINHCKRTQGTKQEYAILSPSALDSLRFVYRPYLHDNNVIAARGSPLIIRIYRTRIFCTIYDKILHVRQYATRNNKNLLNIPWIK